MRKLRLRTQLAMIVVFLTLYSAAVYVSYQIQARAQADLEAAFRGDLAVVTGLPRLDDELRQLELLTDQYLLTGNAAWLHERRRVAGNIRVLQAELSGLLSGGKEEMLWRQMDRELSQYLVQQELWTLRKASGRLTVANAVRVEGQTRRFDEVLASIARMRDASLGELQERRRAARRASRVTFDMTVLMGLVVGGVLALLVSWYLIDPLSELERYARAWQLGDEWSLKPPQAGPELASLFACLKEMAHRLNGQFVKEQELAQFKSQLVSLVSHEFNNAVSIINGVSGLLEDTENERGDEAKRSHYYDVLKSNIRSLHVAANNLLNMGRLESGKFAISQRPVLLADLVRQCGQRLEILALRKQLAMEYDFPPGPVAVTADPDALSLAVTNLLSNAIKYTPEKGRVRVAIRADAAPGRVRLAVEDTGIGIKPEDQEKVFTGYYRTERGKAAAKGFGVGLPLAKRIVEAHDSVLEVQSAPGQGSTFSFSLPVSAGT